MATDFILPDIGEGIVECELVEWLVKEGDRVEEDQPVADIQTDKALVQIPCQFAGRITKLYYKQGEIARVHEPLFALDTDENMAVSNTSSFQSEPEQSGSKGALNASDNRAPVNQIQTSNNSAIGETQPEVPFNEIIEFIMPDVGEGIVECEIVEWLVAEGDEITEDQPVADVQTDKALVQIPSKYQGQVTKLHYKTGDIARVHEPLFQLSVAGSKPDSLKIIQETESNRDNNQAIGTGSSSVSTDQSAPAVRDIATDHLSDVELRRIRTLASPAVRRLAREHHLELTNIAGSGRQGRVLKEDILNYLESGDSEKTGQGEDHLRKSSSRMEKLSGIKAAMAKRMTASVQTIPHFTYAEDIDLTKLIALRLQLKPEFERQGVKLTMMPFFVKALSLALLKHDILNAHLNDAGDEITYFTDHNIGMAVDTPKGLLVPNIKQVQNLSLIEVAQQVNALAESGRAGRLAPDQMKKGTITISNIGVLGGTVTTPIINKPEVAIVGLGKTQKLPRFDEHDQVVARHIMPVSWSGDHRVLDGGIIARFSNDWKYYLENPQAMLIYMR